MFIFSNTFTGQHINAFKKKIKIINKGNFHILDLKRNQQNTDIPTSPNSKTTLRYLRMTFPREPRTIGVKSDRTRSPWSERLKVTGKELRASRGNLYKRGKKREPHSESACHLFDHICAMPRRGRRMYSHTCRHVSTLATSLRHATSHRFSRESAGSRVFADYHSLFSQTLRSHFLLVNSPLTSPLSTKEWVVVVVFGRFRGVGGGWGGKSFVTSASKK